jgi:hypothetical protein
MRKRSFALLPLIALILIFLAARWYIAHRHWVRVEERKQQITEKIAAIKEGMDESAVIKILGEPDSAQLVSANEPGNILGGKYKNVLRYRYDIYLGDLPFTVEGGSWAGVSVYFDEENKRVIYVRSLVF